MADISFVPFAFAVTWTALALTGFVVAGLVRQVHELRHTAVALPKPRIGEQVPGHVIPGAIGGDSTPVTLLLVKEGCSVCSSVLSTLEDIASTDSNLTVVYPGQLPRSAPEGIRLIGQGHSLFDYLRVVATPHVAVLDTAGRLRISQPVGSPQALKSIIEQNRAGSSVAAIGSKDG